MIFMFLFGIDCMVCIELGDKRLDTTYLSDVFKKLDEAIIKQQRNKIRFIVAKRIIMYLCARIVAAIGAESWIGESNSKFGHFCCVPLSHE